MQGSDFVMYEEEFKQIDEELNRLLAQANAKVVFLVDKNGQLIAATGETENLDTTSLASLTAGNIAATGGMAKLLAARAAWAAADNALQIHGGNGFALEYPVSRVLCDARILSIFEGAAEIQAHVIARRLLEG